MFSFRVGDEWLARRVSLNAFQITSRGARPESFNDVLYRYHFALNSRVSMENISKRYGEKFGRREKRGAKVYNVTQKQLFRTLSLLSITWKVSETRESCYRFMRSLDVLVSSVISSALGAPVWALVCPLEFSAKVNKTHFSFSSGFRYDENVIKNVLSSWFYFVRIKESAGTWRLNGTSPPNARAERDSDKVSLPDPLNCDLIYWSFMKAIPDHCIFIKFLR